jgi:hypothetical protein
MVVENCMGVMKLGKKIFVLTKAKKQVVYINIVTSIYRHCVTIPKCRKTILLFLCC